MVRKRARSQRIDLRSGRRENTYVTRRQADLSDTVRRPSVGVRPSSVCDYCAGPIYGGVAHDHPEAAT